MNVFTITTFKVPVWHLWQRCRESGLETEWKPTPAYHCPKLTMGILRYFSISQYIYNIHIHMYVHIQYAKYIYNISVQYISIQFYDPWTGEKYPLTELSGEAPRSNRLAWVLRKERLSLRAGEQRSSSQREQPGPEKCPTCLRTCVPWQDPSRPCVLC